MKVIGKVWFNSYGVNEVVVEVEGSNESEVWTKLLNNELLKGCSKGDFEFDEEEGLLVFDGMGVEIN